MAIDLDPLYHTETMVKIFREQGSSLHAMELAEIILEKNPGNESVREILGELKKEARISFEKFRQAGRVEPQASAGMESPPVEGAEVLEFQGGGSTNLKQEKIKRLRSFLNQVQSFRKKDG
ncbi:MAG: hypothetical protein R3257_01315 [bacterium]|nr:hypothetical protein [bacterium]